MQPAEYAAQSLSADLLAQSLQRYRRKRLLHRAAKSSTAPYDRHVSGRGQIGRTLPTSTALVDFPKSPVDPVTTVRPVLSPQQGAAHEN
jgi:hypothetical protein